MVVTKIAVMVVTDKPYKNKVVKGKSMDNIYDRLKELLEEYEYAKESTYDFGTYWTYEKVIDDLEEILLKEDFKR